MPNAAQDKLMAIKVASLPKKDQQWLLNNMDSTKRQRLQRFIRSAQKYVPIQSLLKSNSSVAQIESKVLAANVYSGPLTKWLDSLDNNESMPANSKQWIKKLAQEVKSGD